MTKLTTEELPQKPPTPPFYVDDDGDICDAEGWLVCCPAYDVWPARKDVSQDICAALNENAALRAEVEKLRQTLARCCALSEPCRSREAMASDLRDIHNIARAALGEGNDQ